MIQRFQEIVLHFLTCLRQTPLLLSWMLLGPCVAFFIDGWMGTVLSIVNLILAGFYALLIRWMTPNTPTPIPIKRPRLELGIALFLFCLFLLIQLIHFGIWAIQPWQGWLSNFFSGIDRAILDTPGIPEWAKTRIFLAISSTIKNLIPILLVFWILGYRSKGMGFSQPNWRLTAILVGLTAAFGLVTGVLTRAPLVQVFGLYCIGILVNALPEELFFRGLLLPRLEKVLKSPLNALVISALIFNALHIPNWISNGLTPSTSIISIYSLTEPTGLIWGYLFLRTRSIIPGTLWHGANGNLGFLFMNF